MARTSENDSSLQDADSSSALDRDTSDVQKSVVKSTAGMTVATLASRITGLIRTWAMAFALGNTVLTSAYQVANNLPNVIYDLVAGGLLAAAFLPVLLLELERNGERGFNRFGSNILNICLVVLGILSLLATIFAEPLVFTQTFTVSQGSEISSTATYLFRIFAVQLLFYGLGGVITGILNSRRSYFLTSIAPALNNVCVIAGFFAYILIAQTNPTLALNVLAVATTLGVAVQFVIQIPALARVGFSWQPVLDFRDPALVDTLKIAIPTLIFIIGNLVAFSCRNAFSLLGGNEGPATLNYAWMWFQLPYGVVAVSLSRAMFTEMSEVSAKQDWETLRRYVNRGLRGTLFLIIPLAGLMFALGTPIIQLFRAGAFTSDAVDTVAHVLRLWVISLPLYSVYMYLYNTFASIRRFLPFALMNCVLVVVQVGLYALLCQPDIQGVSGVPIADFAYYAIGAIGAIILLQRFVGTIDVSSILWVSIRVLVATLIGMAAAYGIVVVLPLDSGIGAALLEIILGGVAGLVIIIVISRVLKIDEAHILDSVVSRFKRR